MFLCFIYHMCKVEVGAYQIFNLFVLRSFMFPSNNFTEEGSI